MTSRGGDNYSWDYFFPPSSMDELSQSPPPMVDIEPVPPELVEIVPILHVANEVEASNPRVAYLCRFYAYEKSHKLDPRSSGNGVREFKTDLLKRLEWEDKESMVSRGRKSDAREIQSFYKHYCSNHIKDQEIDSADKAEGAQLNKAYQTSSILFEVVKAVNKTEAMETEEEVAIRTQAVDNSGELMVDIEAVPPSLVENIVPILRAANEVEASNPRVAYLCRFYAFEKSHKLNPRSTGHGVHAFKTAFLNRLERENEASMVKREEKTDALEMQSFYQNYYSNHIKDQQNDSADKADRTQLTKAFETASILFEVLKYAMPEEVEESEKEMPYTSGSTTHYGPLGINTSAPTDLESMRMEPHESG